ncbi:MAG: hypothetical protein ACTSWM_10810 [Alphaproteobacteria bacterium]
MIGRLAITDIIALLLVAALIAFGIVIVASPGSGQAATTSIGFGKYTIATGNAYLAFGFLLVTMFALNRRATHSMGGERSENGHNALTDAAAKQQGKKTDNQVTNQIPIKKSVQNIRKGRNTIAAIIGITSVASLVVGGIAFYEKSAAVGLSKWSMENGKNRSFGIYRLYGGTTTRDYEVCFGKMSKTSDSSVILYDGVGLQKKLTIVERCAEVRATNYLIIERKTNNGEISGTYRRLR